MSEEVFLDEGGEVNGHAEHGDVVEANEVSRTQSVSKDSPPSLAPKPKRPMSGRCLESNLQNKFEFNVQEPQN